MLAEAANVYVEGDIIGPSLFFVPILSLDLRRIMAGSPKVRGVVMTSNSVAVHLNWCKCSIDYSWPELIVDDTICD